MPYAASVLRVDQGNHVPPTILQSGYSCFLERTGPRKSSVLMPEASSLLLTEHLLIEKEIRFHHFLHYVNSKSHVIDLFTQPPDEHCITSSIFMHNQHRL